MHTYRFYTGVGSRSTPSDILAVMENLAAKLASDGWTVRTGDARGADAAFVRGAGSVDTPFLSTHTYTADDATPRGMQMAALYHGAWDRCSDFAKCLHARNANQVLGPDLNNPSKFLVCWTPDGCCAHATRSIKTGGTGTAISIAHAHGVSVFNLQRQDHLKRVTRWLV